MMTATETKPEDRELAPVKGSWHLQIRLNGGYASIYDDTNEKTFATEERAWDCARRCYPDTEHMTLRVVFIPH